MITFKEWLLEARTFNKLPDFKQEHPEYDDINGWRVYYDIPQDKMQKYITHARSIVKQATSSLQSMNLRKGLRVPIVLRISQGYMGGQYIPPRKAEPGNYVISYIGESDSVGMLVHEITHGLFFRIPAEKQEQIKKWAYQYPNISDYANPAYRDSESHENGSEWFSEFIRSLATRPSSLKKIPFDIIRNIKTWISETNVEPRLQVGLPPLKPASDGQDHSDEMN